VRTVLNGGLNSDGAASLGAPDARGSLPANGLPTVALFISCLTPYHVTTLRRLRDYLGELHIFVSTSKEPWLCQEAEGGDLSVTVQRCWSYATKWRHEQGFSDRIWRRFPYDTLSILFRVRPRVVISLQLGFRTLQAALYRCLVPSSRLIIWTPLSEHTEKGLSVFGVIIR
jgi:hypothetical protein